MPTLRVGGSELFYVRTRGDRLPVVLVHGAGGDHLVWPPALRRLPGRAVYALDLPGHGRSRGEGRERIEDYVADLLGFLDSTGVERAVLVGHSMGGAIVQQTALTAPGRVAGLALLGCGARLRVSDTLLEGLEQDLERTCQLISEWSWGTAADPALVARGLRLMKAAGPQTLRGDFLACDRFDVRERVAEIGVHTCVLTGSEDRMTPPRLGQWLADHIPGARFSLVPAAGHMLMLERPLEVAEELETFLEELSTPC
jgi:pimeloyl-ACP methyl ester carboxylesterase